MNVLLTGATGYLGSRLLAALAKEGGHTLAALVRPTSNRASIEAIARRAPDVKPIEVLECTSAALYARLAAGEFDLILHSATNYGRRDLARTEIVEANLVLPLRLLDAALRCGRRIAFINTDTMLDKRVSAYSLSKKQFREWLQAYADEIVGINVALEHFFGAGDDPTKFVSHVVRALLRQEPRLALTPGEQERDFIYIDDVVAAFLYITRFAASAARGFYDFELGRGEPVTVRAFVELAKGVCGNTVTQLDFGAEPYRPHEVMRIAARTEALGALGWRPALTLEEGLRRMIAEEQR